MWWSLHLFLREGEPPTKLEQLDSAFFSCHNQPSNLFLRQHKTTRTEKNDSLLVKVKEEKNLCFVCEKVNKSEIHSEAQNNSKQNIVQQSPRLRGEREVKYAIKSRPPWAQGKLLAPTPKDSADNSPSAGDTQALSVCRKDPSFGFSLSVSSSLLPFDHPDTATAPSPHSCTSHICRG